MATEWEMQKARQVYYSLVNMLNTRNWKFERFDNDLTIRSGIKGEDLPIEFIMLVKPENQVIQFLSKLPFNAPEDKRVELAIAVCIANDGLVDGSFDYDISDGDIRYRLTSSYRDSTLGDDLFEYMIMCAASTVDNYNDKFFALAKDLITLDDFAKNENR
ncbi:MAG: YbjN domain-containing protein [Clostridia bacterium]|nr:YbjN domain-containing protein [Clostridia bacterium]